MAVYLNRMAMTPRQCAYNSGKPAKLGNFKFIYSGNLCKCDRGI